MRYRILMAYTKRETVEVEAVDEETAKELAAMLVCEDPEDVNYYEVDELD